MFSEKQEEFRKNILSDLGYPVVSVEIDDTQWTKIFQSAARWFNAKKGVLACKVMATSGSKNEYPYPEDADAILDVVMPMQSDIQSLLSLGFFDVVPLNALNIGAVNSAFNSYSAYVQILQALETRRRVFGGEPMWEDNRAKRTFYAGGGGCVGVGSAGQMLVMYKKKNFLFEELDSRDEQIMYEYCQALAYEVLAFIRGKYESYPVPGGTVTTDAGVLRDMAKEIKERLNEEISESQGPMGFLIG